MANAALLERLAVSMLPGLMLSVMSTMPTLQVRMALVALVDRTVTRN
jgi:ABC-type multidrug transport system permease subunit